MSAKKRDWYQELSKRIDRLSLNYDISQLSASQICAKIEWCWRWKHITDEQKDDLCERMIEYFKMCTL